MAKKICGCNLNIASILFLIDVFASRILSKHNIQYSLLRSRKSFDMTNYCCHVQNQYLNALHSLISFIHESETPNNTFPSTVIFNLLKYIYTEGDKLTGSITGVCLNINYT